MSNEGSEVAVIYMQRNTVVTVQCMKDGRFLCCVGQSVSGGVGTTCGGSHMWHAG